MENTKVMLKLKRLFVYDEFFFLLLSYFDKHSIYKIDQQRCCFFPIEILNATDSHELMKWFLYS